MPSYSRFGKYSPLTFAFLFGVFFTSIFGVINAYAQGQVNLIRACVNERSGEIHILLGNKKCGKNEEVLEWNKEGVPGPQGIQGIQGLPGQDGSGSSSSNSYIVCTVCTEKQILDRLGVPSLVNAELDFAVLPEAKLQNVNMSGGSFKNVLFPKADVRGSNFSNSNLSNSYWRNGLLYDSNLTNANFTGADFSEAQLTGATTTGAIFTDVIWYFTNCPDGTNSDNNGGTCAGHL